jgi:hypothetical protein
MPHLFSAVATQHLQQDQTGAATYQVLGPEAFGVKGDKAAMATFEVFGQRYFTAAINLSEPNQDRSLRSKTHCARSFAKGHNPCGFDHCLIAG